MSKKIKEKLKKRKNIVGKVCNFIVKKIVMSRNNRVEKDCNFINFIQFIKKLIVLLRKLHINNKIKIKIKFKLKTN
jgi:hypothetical protein